MKKIVKEAGDIRFSGEAGINSICFKSYKVNGPVSITRDGCVAQINDKGEISCTDTKSYIGERKTLYKQMNQMKEKYQKFFFIMAVVFFVASITVGLISINLMNIALSVFFFFIGCANCSGVVGLFWGKITKNKKIINVLKFHSAEHAAINAYYDLQRVPTLREIRNYSNFSYNCGSLSEIKRGTPFFFLAIGRLFPNVWYFVAIIILFIIYSIIYYKTQLYFMEILVTAEPTDKEYKVAIAGIEYADKQVRDIKFDKEFSENMAISLGFLKMLFEEKEFSEEKCKDCASYQSCKKINENPQ